MMSCMAFLPPMRIPKPTGPPSAEQLRAQRMVGWILYAEWLFVGGIGVGVGFAKHSAGWGMLAVLLACLVLLVVGAFGSLVGFGFIAVRDVRRERREPRT